MKRFFIFAAMLLTMTANAGNLSDDPPKIKPPVEKIVLMPQGMYEIDRTIPICEYRLCQETGSIFISCFGTGSDTELYLVDSRGQIVEYAAIDPNINSSVSFTMPEEAGIYYIVLTSRTYYGEGCLEIE